MKFKTSNKPNETAVSPDVLFTEREKRKLIIMGVVMVAVIGGLAWQMLGGGLGRKQPPTAPAEEVASVEVVKPTLRVDEYRAKAKDATREERSLLESDALAIALDDSKLYNAIHFSAMEGADLDAAHAAELARDSSAQRGRIFRLRGTVMSMLQFPPSDTVGGHYRGRLQLEDGSTAYFAFAKGVDYEFGTDDFVMLEGLFLKNYAEESNGLWAEGPLVVGPRAYRSYPAIGRVTAIAPSDFEVRDEAFDDSSTESRREYWRLVSYVRDVDQTKIDWSVARELDTATMQQLSADPARFFAVPLRIPPARMQAIWRQRQKENPARVDDLTLGWIGSGEWLRTDNPVIYFSALVPNPGFGIGSECTATGYFLRMFEYEAVGGTRRAPHFVLTSLTPYVTPKDKTLNLVLAVVASVCLGLVVLFWFLLRRDSVKSRELDQELIRRRRARREKSVAT